MTGRQPQAGFTFLELLVVIAVLAVITATVIPLYGASVTAMKQRGARGDLTATLLHLQELSIRQSRELRLYLDDDRQAYWAAGWTAGLGDEKVFEALPKNGLGNKRHLPEGLLFARIDARRDNREGVDFVAFYPNGSCDVAEIRLGARKGGRADVVVSLNGTLGQVAVSP